MSNDDIALSFDTAEYYSLQEACDYLNRKHKTDNIIPKKLLKKIIQWEVPLFIYGKNFQITGDYVMESFLSIKHMKNDVELYEKKRKEILNLNKAVYKQLDSMLSALMENTGAFLRLDIETIRTILFDGKATTDKVEESCVFTGILPTISPHNDASSLDYLDEYLLDFFQDSVAFTLSIHPSIDIFLDDNEDLYSAINRNLKHCIPKVVDYYFIENSSRRTSIFPYFHIDIDGLILLSSGIEKIEKHLLSITEISNELTNLDEDFLKKKGISPKKLLAKHIAKHIAEKNWLQDTENKIKITEMAEITYSHLYSIGFNNELPDQAKSIRSWIKEVAPEYASEAGRPKS